MLFADGLHHLKDDFQWIAFAFEQMMIPCRAGEAI